MARKKHLINVHTSTGTTAPTGASLYLGEIAVQHTPNDPALWIKVGSAETSTEYEKFIGLTEITNIFNMSQILGSGYTYSGIPYVNSATTIADAYSALTKELIDDELVTAAALNDLNDRIPEPVDLEPLSASVVTNVQNINILSAVVEENELVTAAALNDLNDKINMISANTSGDYITREEFEDHEEVAAAAFNDLNSRIIDLSGDTDERINNINSQFTVLSGMVLELSGNSGAGAITSVTIDGSGNVVTNATYVNSALTITKGIVEAEILGSGYTYSGLPYVNSATSIADAYSAITKELIDDEKVTAAALNDLNDRIANVPSSADVESLSAVVFTLSATLEDDELVIAAALNDLNDKVNTISASTSGNYMTVEEYEEKEEVIAAALNDLNARIIDLSGDTSDISDSVSNHDQQIQVLSGLVADISGNTGGGGAAVFVPGTGTDSIKSIYGGVLASGQLSYAEGIVSSALSVGSHVEGYNSVVGGSYTSHTINPPSADTTPGSYGHAEGRGTIVVGTNGAHAEGNRTFAQGSASHAEGNITVAKGPGSHAEGQRTLAAGQLSHAEGLYAQAIGHIAHAEGYYTSALSQYSHVEGQCCVTSGEASHAEGQFTFTMNESSHAEGRNSSGTGVSSHAEGAQTLACGSPSHSEGFYSIASGVSSHAEGYSTSAISTGSHTEGFYTVARNIAEHACGHYNVSNGAQNAHDGDTMGDDADSAQTLFSIGVGIGEEYRKNAYEVMQNGDAYLLGVGSYNGTNFATANTLQKTINDKLVGVTINGASAPVTNGVAALGTVVTAQTQLSKGTTTGTGNVVTDLSVSNHQITLTKSYSAAPADQFVTLSGAAHSKITALSAATTGINSTLTTHTGNGDIHVTSAQKTNWTNSGTSGANAYVGYIAHSANTGIHVTSTQKDTWNGKQDAISDLSTIRNNASSGASAYTGVTALSAATTAMSANVAKIAVTGVTVTGTGNAITDATYANSALTLTKGNVQATISDLSTIRNNAASGMAAYNNVNSLSAGTISALAGKSNTGHTHSISEVTNLQTTLDGKSNTGHTHAISEITNLQTTLNGKSDTGHSHSEYASSANVTSLSSATVSTRNTLTAHTGDTGIHVTSTEKSTWNGKQNAISDLSTIRNNASSGASAYTGVTALSGATTAHTANTAIHVPTGGTNGQVLMMVNGTPAWANPISVYTGSGTPSQSLGDDGDIYLQTS